MSAGNDEYPSLHFQNIRKKTALQTNTRKDGQTDNVKTVYPPQTSFVCVCVCSGGRGRGGGGGGGFKHAM